MLLEENLKEEMQSWDFNTKVKYIEFGNDSHRDTLVYDEHSYIRSKIAQYGNDSHRDILIHDEHWGVRAEVAEHGNDGHQAFLIDDEDWGVRAQVAQYGNNSHRDTLVHDENWIVRTRVAEYGNDSHRAILIHDDNCTTRNKALKFLGSKKHVISKNFGTYDGENAIYVFEDKYLVISGCYETSRLDVWVEQAKDRGLTQEVINKEVFKINCILKDVGLT